MDNGSAGELCVGGKKLISQERPLNKVVELNVRGKLLTTLLSTLKKESPTRLSKMFDDPSQILLDKDGRVFIDFDKNIFEHVLNYLRNGSIPPKEMIVEVYECAQYFGIRSMVAALKDYQPLARKIAITKMKSGFDKEQYDTLKQFAIEVLNDSFHPESDKYFIFVTSTNDCPTTDALQNDQHRGYVHAIKSMCGINPFEIKLQSEALALSNANVNEEMMKCLCHNLSELGFGSVSYYKHCQLECIYCGFIDASAIFLCNKILQGEFYGWKSY